MFAGRTTMVLMLAMKTILVLFVFSVNCLSVHHPSIVEFTPLKLSGAFRIVWLQLYQYHPRKVTSSHYAPSQPEALYCPAHHEGDLKWSPGKPLPGPKPQTTQSWCLHNPIPLLLLLSVIKIALKEPQWNGSCAISFELQ